MSVTSARPANLQKFVDDGYSNRLQLASALDSAVKKVTAVAAACGYGYPSSHSLQGLSDLVTQMYSNETFVATVRDAVVAADGYSGTGTVSDASIEAALTAAGVAVKPAIVTVAAMEMYGLVPTSGFIDDPICAATGNFVHGDQDLLFPAFSAVLNLDRIYNSLASRTAGHFGFGWTCLLDMRVEPPVDGVAVVHLADGAHIPFQQDEEGAFGVYHRRWLHLAANSDGFQLTDQDGTSWCFDAVGQLNGIRNRGADVTVDRAPDSIRLAERNSGRWVAFELVDGRVVRVEANDGRACGYRYEAGALVVAEREIGDVRYNVRSGLIESIVDADGVTLCRNEFDETGRVLAQLSSHGRRTTYEYLESGVTRVLSDDGPNNVMIHDRSGHLTSMIDGNGKSMQFVRDGRGMPLSITDRCGRTTRYLYDERGQLTRRLDPDGLEHTWDYDEQGRPIEDRDRAGAISRFAYEGDGPAPSRIEFADGSVMQAEYDERGLPLRVIDADGVVSTFKWNADGQLTALVDGLGGRTEFDFAASGASIGARNPSGVFARMRLDAAGRVVEIATADGSESFRYSAAGRVIGGTALDGSEWTAAFNDAGDVEVITDGASNSLRLEYDRMGNIVTVQAPDGARFLHEFDAVGRPVRALDPAGNATEMGYDDEGRMTSVTDALSRTWTREVDVLGRTVTHVEPSGASTVRTYHPNGEVATVVDPLGHTWQQAVDPLGRTVELVDPLGGRSRRSYTAAGRLASSQSPGGEQLTWSYDAAGRVASMSDGGGVDLALERRSDGKVSRVTVDGGITELQYHGSGRLSSVHGPRGARVSTFADGRLATDSFAPRPAAFEWDPRGLLARVSDPAGVVTTFVNDVRGRVTETITIDQSTKFEYDAAGWLSRVIDPYGRATDIENDRVGLPARVARADGSELVYERSWFETPDRILGDGTELVAFVRDARGQLIEARTANATVLLVRDALGRVVSAADASSTVDYTWDLDGRIATRTTHDTTLSLERAPDGTPVRYVLGDGFSIAAPGDVERRRDDLGRLVADEHGSTFRYDDEGRLAEWVDSSGVVHGYRYDERGLLAEESSDEVAVRMTYGLAGEPLRRTVSGGASTEYEHDVRGRRRIQRSTDGSSVEYTWDLLDRVTGIVSTDASGVRVQHDIAYDAFGSPAEIDGVPITWDRGYSNDVLAIGDRHFLRHGAFNLELGSDVEWKSCRPQDPWGDSASKGLHLGFRGSLSLGNLVFLGKRVYDSTTRTFLSRDPLPPLPGALAFAGHYSYAWNDPVNFLDPTGQRPLSDKEYDAIRKNLEKGTFEKAWDSIKEDPWGTLAMVAVVAAGLAVGGPIGVGILIGVGIAGGVGLATGTFNPRSVAISGVIGGVTGGIFAGPSGALSSGLQAGFAGGVGSVADQMLARGRGLDELDPREIVLAAGVTGGAVGVGKYITRGIPSIADDLGNTPSGATPGRGAGWRGTNMSVDDSISYHWNKHGAGRTLDEYLADSRRWAQSVDLPAGRPVTLADGTQGFRIRTPGGGPGGIVDADRNLITFWYR